MEFIKYINEISDVTHNWDLPNIVAFKNPDNHDFHKFVVLTNDEKLEKVNNKYCTSYISDEGAEESLLFLEMNDSGKIEHSYVMSEHAMLTLLQKVQLKGRPLYDPADAFLRNSFIASELRARTRDVSEKPIKIIYREVDGICKIFAFTSDSYQEFLQKGIEYIIDDILNMDSFGKAYCKDWNICQTFTEISFLYPDYAKEMAVKYGIDKDVIPMIRYSTSDTCDACLCVDYGWLMRNTFISQGFISQKHYGTASEDITKDIENAMFGEWEKVPMALCDLMNIDITIDESYLTKVIASTDIKKICGKKNTETFIKETVESVDPMIPMTAYDAYELICGIPNYTTNLSDIQKSNLEKELYKLLFSKKW